MSAKSMKLGRAVRLSILEMSLLVLGMLFVRREIWQLHVMSFGVAFWQEGMLIPFAAIDGAITGAYSSRRRNVQNTPAYKGLLRWGTPLFFILYVGCAALCERLSKGVFPTATNDLVRSLGLTIVLAGMALRIWAQFSSPILLSEPEAPPPVVAPEKTVAGMEGSAETASTEPTDLEAVSSQTGGGVAANPEATDIESAEAPAPNAETPGTKAPSANEVSLPLFPVGPYRLLRHPDAAGKLLSLWGLPLVFNCWIPLLALPGILTLLKWHISDQEAFRISQLGEPYLEYRKKTWNLIPFLY